MTPTLTPAANPARVRAILDAKHQSFRAAQTYLHDANDAASAANKALLSVADTNSAEYHDALTAWKRAANAQTNFDTLWNIEAAEYAETARLAAERGITIEPNHDLNAARFAVQHVRAVRALVTADLTAAIAAQFDTPHA